MKDWKGGRYSEERTRRGGCRKGRREGISPWFKKSYAHREREGALLGLCRGRWGRWKSGGLCICVCVSVCTHVAVFSLCAVCKGRSAIFNIPVSQDLEYQNNLSGSIQMLLPLCTFLSPPLLLYLLCSVFSLCTANAYGSPFQLLSLWQNRYLLLMGGGLRLNQTFVSRDHNVAR